MPRWYRAYILRKKANIALQQLQQLVEVNKLKHQLSAVRVEKEAGYGAWIFLGIDTEEQGSLPEPLKTLLEHFPAIGSPLDRHVRLEEIRTMTSPDIQLHSYILPLPFVPVSRVAPTDPGGVDDEAAPPSEQEIEETERHDRLLLILSIIGSGSLTTLRNIWTELGGNAEHVRPLLRRLRRLGHLETTADLQRWTIAPTVLVSIAADDGSTRYLLCGRRDQRLLHLLNGEEVAAVQYQPQPAGLGPSAVTMVIDNPQLLSRSLRKYGYRVHIAADASLQLAAVLPEQDGWYLQLERIEGVHPYNYELRRYNGHKFVDLRAFDGQTGLYSLRSENRTIGDMTLHYRAADQRWYRGDWFDMRFAVYVESGTPLTYAYDADSRQLQIPAAYRWPELYERALILASGLLPDLRAGNLVYDGVSPELLDTLAPKLRCEPLE